MKVPRNLYGRELADHLIRNWGYLESHQTGSHIILRTEEPSRQTMPVPNHKPLKLGTLTTILRMISDHKQISRDDLLRGL
jgi:predicted RNA binding protein YcfA (HicA-like mRNA interferase family)